MNTKSSEIIPLAKQVKSTVPQIPPEKLQQINKNSKQISSQFVGLEAYWVDKITNKMMLELIT